MQPFVSRFPDTPPPRPMVVVVDSWSRVATYCAGNQTLRPMVVADFSFSDEQQPPSSPDGFELREGNA